MPPCQALVGREALFVPLGDCPGDTPPAPLRSPPPRKPPCRTGKHLPSWGASFHQHPSLGQAGRWASLPPLLPPLEGPSGAVAPPPHPHSSTSWPQQGTEVSFGCWGGDQVPVLPLCKTPFFYLREDPCFQLCSCTNKDPLVRCPPVVLASPRPVQFLPGGGVGFVFPIPAQPYNPRLLLLLLLSEGGDDDPQALAPGGDPSKQTPSLCALFCLSFCSEPPSPPCVLAPGSAPPPHPTHCTLRHSPGSREGRRTPPSKGPDSSLGLPREAFPFAPPPSVLISRVQCRWSLPCPVLAPIRGGERGLRFGPLWPPPIHKTLTAISTPTPQNPLSLSTGSSRLATGFLSPHNHQNFSVVALLSFFSGSTRDFLGLHFFIKESCCLGEGGASAKGCTCNK
ncbi:hypothetical protein JRQ81_008231 [Phrynocephalus forsythii]|uniref:Uncharacterized protein n=1 Tax=Phrynocephalus forsythii TaxID=171643 RepID=A0A9Q1ASQ0_9SAUR|nr:hypothetical protein JRQ81_008231 [Phrynocephalus forsythii]